MSANAKRAIGNASNLSDRRAVFNIAGNKYRIVVWICFMSWPSDTPLDAILQSATYS